MATYMVTVRPVYNHDRRQLFTIKAKNDAEADALAQAVAEEYGSMLMDEYEVETVREIEL